MTRTKTGGRPAIAWTPDMDAAIADYRSRGICWEATARKVGVSITAARSRAVVLREDGTITHPDRTHSPWTRRTPEQTRKLVAMWEAGDSIRKAGRELGIKYGVAKYWARSLGLTEPRT